MIGRPEAIVPSRAAAGGRGVRKEKTNGSSVLLGVVGAFRPDAAESVEDRCGFGNPAGSVGPAGSLDSLADCLAAAVGGHPASWVRSWTQTLRTSLGVDAGPVEK